jgi:hypothetical protein
VGEAESFANSLNHLVTESLVESFYAVRGGDVSVFPNVFASFGNRMSRIYGSSNNSISNESVMLRGHISHFILLSMGQGDMIERLHRLSEISILLRCPS